MLRFGKVVAEPCTIQTIKVPNHNSSLRAPRVARTPLKRSREVGELKPAAPKAAWQAAAPACGAFKDLRRTRSRAGIGSPRFALRASLGRLKRSRAVGGRKPAAVPSNGASLRAPRVARTLASAHLAPRVARTPQMQPGGRRAEACGATGRLPGCGARAFKRSLAEVVRDGAFGGRMLARVLPRS